MSSDEPRSEQPLAGGPEAPRAEQDAPAAALADRGIRASETPAGTDDLSALPDGANFLCALTHQLRNTVFTLTATIDLLEISVPPTPPFAQAATSMRLNTSRLLRILAELDAYGMANTPPWQTLPLTPLLREASTAVASLAEERAVSITMSSPDRPHLLHVEPLALERAVRSLLEFAVLRSPARASVLMSEQPCAGHEVEVRIEDQGPALGPGLLPRALEPFAVRSSDLTGLSLALAARVAQAHGGRLLIEEPGGAGLVARLLLPLASAAPGAGLETGPTHS
jgi:signal transduction histidine kinase